MDRVRVLSPALSGAVHFVGAGLLAFVPVFLADRLPPAPWPLQPLVPVGGGPVVLLGGGGPPRRDPRPVRVTTTLQPTSSVFSLDRLPSDLPPVDGTLDLGDGGPGGIGDGGAPGGGFCLFDCGEGPGTGAGTASLPPEPARPVLRVRAARDVREPVKLRHVDPVYPPLAIATRTEGAVVLECVITTDGRVSEIVAESGHPLLRDAAVEAVGRWRYRPTLLNGEPVAVLLRVTVTFSLR